MNQSSNLSVNTLLTDQVRQVAGTACEPIDAWLDAHRQELVGVRRHLHMHPEPSGLERETTSYLAQRLDEVGVTATVLRDGLGLVADAVIGDPGPGAARVALRADIDALKIVADGVNALRSPDRAFVLITHYQRLLDYIEPDHVHVLADGRIVKSGDKSLAGELESRGYDWVLAEAASA